MADNPAARSARHCRDRQAQAFMTARTLGLRCTGKITPTSSRKAIFLTALAIEDIPSPKFSRRWLVTPIIRTARETFPAPPALTRVGGPVRSARVTHRQRVDHRIARDMDAVGRIHSHGAKPRRATSASGRSAARQTAHDAAVHLLWPWLVDVAAAVSRLDMAHGIGRLR